MCNQSSDIKKQGLASGRPFPSWSLTMRDEMFSQVALSCSALKFWLLCVYLQNTLYCLSVNLPHKALKACMEIFVVVVV